MPPSTPAEFCYRQGATALNAGRLEEAAAHLWSCLAEDPDHAAALHLLGRVRERQGDIEAALRMQLGSWRIAPALGWNAFAAAELLQRQERWSEASAAYQAAAEALPGEGWIASLADRSQGLAVFAGEHLSQGLSTAAYRLWCRRFEPALESRGPLPPQGAPGQGDRDPALPPGWILDRAPDAVLRPGALSWLAGWLASQPEAADLLYTDEDRRTEEGERQAPWFKPGWVPESFWSTPWLGGFALWRRSWLERHGLPAPPAPAEPLARWRWQLQALACQPRIGHIDRILVHRQASSHRAMGPHGAGSAWLAQAAALAEHLRLSGEGEVQVTPGDPAATDPALTPGQADPVFRLCWAAPAVLRLSIVVLSRDRPDLLARCLHGVGGRRGGLDLEWLLVDNGSRLEATAALLRCWRERPGERVEVLPLDQPFNWSLLNNRACRRASGELLLFLNNDVAVPADTAADWLAGMAGQALRPAIGCVGARLLYPDGTVQHAGLLPSMGAGCEHPYRGLRPARAPHRGRLHHLSGWPAVTGACLMVRRELWWLAGGFDPRLPVEGNDVDFCLRLGRMGLRHVVCPQATLLHHEAASRRASASTTWAPAQALLRRRWPEAMAAASPWWPSACSLETPDGRPRELGGRGWI